jgi:glycosyltransferase 2 family protein
VRRWFHWKRLLTALLVAVALWYLGRTVVLNWNELQAHDWQIDPLRLSASLVLHVLVLACGVWIWSLVLRCFGGTRVALPLLLRIWFLSNLARYVPGKVWQFVAVAQLSRERGLSSAVMLSSILIHTGLSLLAAVVVGLMTLPAELAPTLPTAFVVTAGAVGATVLVHPAVLNGMLGVIPRFLRRPVIIWTGRWRDGVLLLGLAGGAWLLYGVAYFLLIDALTPVPVTVLPLLTGVNAWSFVVGYAAFFSIAGLGAREIAMTALLAPVLPAGVAALLAVAARIWTIAAEIIGGLLVLALTRTLPPSASTSADATHTSGAGPA